MVGICLLWFSSGFSLYGLTLGVNSLSGDRYYNSVSATCQHQAHVLCLCRLGCWSVFPDSCARARVCRSRSLSFLQAIMAAAEIPTRLLNIPLMDSRAGRKFGLLMWLLTLAGASITAMFWTQDPGPLTLNVVGRAASAAGFVAVYVASCAAVIACVSSCTS